MFNSLLCFLIVSGADSIESRIFEFQLRNGLEVIGYVDSSAPVVSVNIYYRVGSYDENTGYTGISHMLEHMSFKHTDIYKPGDFDRMLDSVGAFNNGFTSTYYTGYYENIAKERWELALKLEAARMAKCIFPDSEFESEHQVVAEERRLQDNRPTAALWENFDAVAFLANPQRNPTIGWPDDVANFTVEKIREWYKFYYNPANAVLVVSGDIRPEEVQTKVEKYFGKLKGAPVKRADFYNIEPELNGERRFIVRKPVNVPLLLIGYPTPGVRDSLYIIGDVVASVLGAGRNSRLYRTLVVDSGLATSVSVWNSVEKDPGLLYINITPKSDTLIPKIEQLVYQQIKRMQTEPVTEKELNRVKNQALAGYIFDRDDISDIAYYLATSHITTGNWRNFLEQLKRIQSATQEQIMSYCSRYLTDRRRIVGILLPEMEEKQ
uniref:Insulinase family protein n=1 Tax=candidate division WOR-3 bacterium TaxID=2052148 RepID=A0A7V3PV28_UNCW3